MDKKKKSDKKDPAKKNDGRINPCDAIVEHRKMLEKSPK